MNLQPRSIGLDLSSHVSESVKLNMRSLAALTFRKVDRFSGVANVLVKTGKKSLQNQCQPRDPKAIGLVRSYVSERFEITRQGKKLSFTSKKTDSDVMAALHSMDSTNDFTEHLLRAGSEGKWSKNMRAWAHYLSRKTELPESVEEQMTALDAAGILVRVDSREKKLIECLRDSMEIPFSVETLRVGDVIIGRKPFEIFIERKAVPDLVQSMFDTRLFNQLGNQLNQTEYNRLNSLVIVEGNLSQLHVPRPNMQRLPYEAQRRLALATMVRLCLRDQIPVFRTQDLAGTAEIVCTIVQEYPKLMQMRPLQYSTRKEIPFRPRRGEDPKEALASQLRCVRGVSQEIAKRLVKGHNHMQSFITAMMAAEDPVQWLVQKGSHKESRWSRPAAALLAEALAGQAAVERENLICSFQAIHGLTRESATMLVRDFGTRKKLQSFLQGERDPVRALSQLVPGLSLPTRVALVAEIAGKEALEFEEYKNRLASINGVTAATALKISEKFPDAASLCQALIADTSAPDPVSRAMRIAKLSHPAACDLVSEFMEGT